MLYWHWENPSATQASTCAPTGTVCQGTRSPGPARGQKTRFPLEEELTLPNYPRRKHNTRSHPWWVLLPVHAPNTEHANSTATQPAKSTSDALSPSLWELTTGNHPQHPDQPLRTQGNTFGATRHVTLKVCPLVAQQPVLPLQAATDAFTPSSLPENRHVSTRGTFCGRARPLFFLCESPSHTLFRVQLLHVLKGAVPFIPLT